MLVKKDWMKKQGPKEWYYTGWFLFGVVPIIVWRSQNGQALGH